MPDGQWLLRCLSWFFTLALTLGSPASRSSSYDAGYWAQRDRILMDESHISLGGNLELQFSERAANEVLMAAKREEIDRGLWNPGSFLPARNFMTVTEEIRSSRTFQIIRRMPKGAVLHIHDTAMLSSEFIYENITFRENLHICRPEDGSIEFRFLRSTDNDISCASSVGWELLADLRANASVAEEVNNRIRNALTIVVPDPAAAYPDVNTVWTVFRGIFRKIQPLFTYRPVFEDWLYQGLNELCQDNVSYVEIRTGLNKLYDLDGKTYERLDVARLYKTMTDRFVNDNPDFVGAKLILTLSRKAPASRMVEFFLDAVALNKEFPNFVVGIDLVGQEDKGEPLMQFVDKLRAVSPNIKLFLHAGETKWSGVSTDDNLFDAALLNATRIGHGYALPKHPKVMELAEQRGIAVEVNPISNQVLNLVEDMRNHPASFLFSRDYPVVVSCDDPGLWGAVGLSYDFYEAFIGIMSRSADIRALKQLAMNSIKYSAMSVNEKTRALAMWEAKWTMFIRDVGMQLN